MSAKTKVQTSRVNGQVMMPVPDHAARPYSIFDARQKRLIVLLASVAATFSGFASNIYFPALQTVADDLDVSIELVNLTVTSYLIFQGVAPSLWGPVSDVKGRRTAYACTFVVFLGACVGLALTKNYATLIILRCIQSMGSASTIAIGSGVIGDITTRAERGGFMGVYQAGSLLPVAVGPVIGGAMAGSLGWRSIFWFLTIYCGVFLLCLLIALPETLRSIVDNGQESPSSFFTRFPLKWYQKSTKTEFDPRAIPPEPPVRKRIDVFGPFRVLFSRHTSPIIFFLAVHYAVWQMGITAMSTLFQDRYGLNETQTGLTFIANGAGSFLGTLVIGRVLNRDYRKMQEKFTSRAKLSDSEAGGKSLDHGMGSETAFPIENARLRLIPALSILQGLSIILFGWTVQCSERVHIAVPIISTFITGGTLVSMQSAIMTYLVDIFPEKSAAASASLNLARCLFAAGGTSLVTPMIDGVGVGPAFTICAVAQLLAMSGFLVQWRFARIWRKRGQEEADVI